MTREMIAQASEFLLVYLTTPSADDAPDRLSAIFNLIYQERLNREPIDLSNPAAVLHDIAGQMAEEEEHPWRPPEP